VPERNTQSLQGWQNRRVFAGFARPYEFADSESLVQLQLCDLCAYILSKQAANTKHGTALKPGIQ